MKYCEDYHYLKELFDSEAAEVEDQDKKFSIHRLQFASENYRILPGEDRYEDRGEIFSRTPDYQNAISPEINELLNLEDSKVTENKRFSYTIFKPKNGTKAKEVIILLHGLNEKTWHKYLPWAKILMEITGKTVVLFPIAFHMNRAPAAWSDFRLMNDLRYVREGLFPAISGSSFANIAMSTRLHILPQRFFWSGVQTFKDILQLMNEAKAGSHPLIDQNASFDFFAYSIGAFLTEVLMMSNPEGLFSQSKLFMFAGGAVFNRMSPVQKTILDSEANIALYSFFLENFDSYLKVDKRLAHYFSQAHPEGMVFRSMLDYHKLREFREEKLKAISERIAAIALRKDKVVSCYEVQNTLNGADRDIPVEVKVVDPPYNYTHENPFPVKEKIQEEVNIAFDEIFGIAGEFLR
jgi:hypothetical protein